MAAEPKGSIFPNLDNELDALRSHLDNRFDRLWGRISNRLDELDSMIQAGALGDAKAAVASLHEKLDSFRADINAAKSGTSGAST